METDSCVTGVSDSITRYDLTGLAKSYEELNIFSRVDKAIREYGDYLTALVLVIMAVRMIVHVFVMVQSYLMNKLALFNLAFTSNEQSFNTLMLHMIKGLCNNAVRRMVRRANPLDGKEIVDKHRGRPSFSREKESNSKKKRCYNCGKGGHFAKEWWSPKQQNNTLEEDLDLWEEEEESVSFLGQIIAAH